MVQKAEQFVGVIHWQIVVGAGDDDKSGGEDKEKTSSVETQFELLWANVEW